MPSYISNSKAHNWGKSWIVALIIAAIFLGGLECFWRVNGHQPAIVDDQRLWAMERKKVGKSPKEIVLLGSSRMQTDISIATLKKLAPYHNIINLSADGTCANATLRNLAEERNFKGIVIVETTSECLMFGDQSGLSQQFYVDYYYRVYNLNIKINRIIATFFQSNITIIDPYLNLIKVIGDKIVKNKWRTPNYVTTHEDRSRSADYTKLDIEHHKAIRLQKIEANYRQLSPNISMQTLIDQVAKLDNAAKQIQKQGGNVVFARFPVSEEHWIIDEQYFPRNKYWDTIIPLTSATVIHFKDIDVINKLQCPDTSHLDVRDKNTFTKVLIEKLFRDKNNLI